MRNVYNERGYDCYVSAQAKHGVPCYLLERMLRIRATNDPAYLKMVQVFGDELLKEFHRLAAAAR